MLLVAIFCCCSGCAAVPLLLPVQTVVDCVLDDCDVEPITATVLSPLYASVLEGMVAFLLLLECAGFLVTVEVSVLSWLLTEAAVIVISGSVFLVVVVFLVALAYDSSPLSTGLEISSWLS